MLSAFASATTADASKFRARSASVLYSDSFADRFTLQMRGCVDSLTRQHSERDESACMPADCKGR